jgi:hypothetical protein
MCGVTEQSVEGINATLPAERGGQAPKPRSGAPKAQGLRATLGRIMIIDAVKRLDVTKPTVPTSIGYRIYTILTDVTGIVWVSAQADSP